MHLLERQEETVIWHKSFTISGRDNIQKLPAEKAVFAIFAIINEEPANCRYVGQTENLPRSVRLLFEEPGSPGLRRFMQGSWVRMIRYQLMPSSTTDEMEKVREEWQKEFRPAIDEDGQYPGYYE
jgi:hypothetical protein